MEKQKNKDKASLQNGSRKSVTYGEGISTLQCLSYDGTFN